MKAGTFQFTMGMYVQIRNVRNRVDHCCVGQESYSWDFLNAPVHRKYLGGAFRGTRASGLIALAQRHCLRALLREPSLIVVQLISIFNHGSTNGSRSSLVPRCQTWRTFNLPAMIELELQLSRMMAAFPHHPKPFQLESFEAVSSRATLTAVRLWGVPCRGLFHIFCAVTFRTYIAHRPPKRHATDSVAVFGVQSPRYSYISQ